MGDKDIYNVLGDEYFIMHREAVTVDELVEMGKLLGVID